MPLWPEGVVSSAPHDEQCSTTILARLLLAGLTDNAHKRSPKEPHPYYLGNRPSSVATNDGAGGSHAARFVSSAH